MRLRIKSSFAAILFAAALPIFAEKPTSGGSQRFSCQFNGCQSFRQLEKTSDPDFKDRIWCVFYKGDNPASKDKNTPTTDEFLLLMQGRKSTMRNGIHPGVFVNVVKDGLPQGYRGYGPHAESDVVEDGLPKSPHRPNGESNVEKGSDYSYAYTYDDLGETVQFAYFFFGRQSFWTEKGLKLTDEPVVRQYEETKIRKSTGQFVQRMNDFDASPSPLTLTYKGQCFSTKEIS